jgi:hypothetical protein
LLPFSRPFLYPLDQFKKLVMPRIISNRSRKTI